MLPNKENIKYTAFFVDNSKELLQMFSPVHKNIYAHHSTNAYKPEKIDNLEVGKKSVLKIIGRAFDDKGDALFVENTKTENEFAHITLSCAEGVTPDYSNILLEKSYINATLEIFDTPVFIEVTEGYCDIENNIHLVSNTNPVPQQ